MRVVAAIASVVSLACGLAIAGPAHAGGPEPTSPEVLIAKATTSLGIHFRVTGYTYGPDSDVWVTIHERSDTSSGTFSGAGLDPSCGKASFGVSYSNLADGPQLALNGPAKPGVKRVRAILKPDGKRRRVRDVRVVVMPRKSAEVLGVERSGWWFTDFARVGAAPRVAAGLPRGRDRLAKPFQTWALDGYFQCSDGSLPRAAFR